MLVQKNEKMCTCWNRRCRAVCSVFFLFHSHSQCVICAVVKCDCRVIERATLYASFHFIKLRLNELKKNTVSLKYVSNFVCYDLCVTLHIHRICEYLNLWLRFNAVQLSTLSKTYLRKILPCGAQYIPCNFCETFIFFFPSKNDFNFSPKTAITTNCVEQWINW